MLSSGCRATHSMRSLLGRRRHEGKVAETPPERFRLAARRLGERTHGQRRPRAARWRPVVVKRPFDPDRVHLRCLAPPEQLDEWRRREAGKPPQGLARPGCAQLLAGREQQFEAP